MTSRRRAHVPRLAIWGLLAAGLVGPAAAASPSILDDPNFVAHLDRGLARLYNLEVDAARAELGAAAAAAPDHPVGPFLDALPAWWSLLLDPDDPAPRRPVLAAMEETLARCARRLERDPRDADARFFMAAALAVRGRLRSLAGEWIAAARDGKRALDLVRELHREQPANEDLYYGLGLYDYYADVIPEEYPVFRPLKPFFPPADRARGLARLERAMRQGRFSRAEAAYALLEIEYLWREDAARALVHARWLRSLYPGNPVFVTYEGRSLAMLGDWSAARAVFVEVLRRRAAGRSGFGPYQEEMARYFLGRGALEERRYDEALAALAELERVASARNSVSRYRTLGQLASGMAHDALGRRPQAVARYRRVLTMRDSAGAHQRARQHLDRPFAPQAPAPKKSSR
ncbi:MAG TPA: hypothetical protein VFE44_08775 [Thermoanaerobaculia bacterium]|nr:hypothetical protein [Thermoanaerobaculia bacterium]